MNINDFLKENQINKRNFDTKEIPLKDIILFNKKFTQKIESRIEQRKTEHEEALRGRKKELSSVAQFKAEDFEIGDHVEAGVEPGSFLIDDCITCDGHGEITCPSCNGTGETECKKCGGKTQLKKERTFVETKEIPCPSCNGAKVVKKRCSSCSGKGIKINKVACQGCKGTGKINKGIDPQTKRASFSPCTVCRGSRFQTTQSPCPQCKGSGFKELVCPACGGVGTKRKKITRKESYYVKCNGCAGRGRVVCRKCRGAQSLPCPTCEGERRTIQYQYNVFKLSVKLDPHLVVNDDIKDAEAILSIGLAPRVKVTYLLPGEKEKLKNKLISLNMSMDTRTSSRIDGKLWQLRDKKTGSNYYIYESKGDCFCKIKPPSTGFESYFYHYLRITKNFINNNILVLWKKIVNKLTNKKEY